MHNLIGQTLGGYRIISELGHGGMADVYLASQRSIGRQVAIKVLPAHLLQDRNFLERFNREVKVIAQLQHPHIVPVYDFGEHDNLPYIVMAYVPGGTLADRIKQSNRGLPLEDVVDLTEQIASGLHHAHEQNIIHRDFKPSNVLLDGKGNAYLSDFGIAKVTTETAQLTGSGLIGTPAYMAPEMSQPGAISPLIDIYALGATLFQMLTGREPFQADTPMGVMLAHATQQVPNANTLRPDLPNGMQTLIEKALAKDPAHRYRSARTMANDLRKVVGKPVEAHDPQTFKIDVLPIAQKTFAATVLKRSPRWVVAGTLVLAALILLGLYIFGVFGRPLVVITPTTSNSLAEQGVSRNADWTPHVEQFSNVNMALVPAGCLTLTANINPSSSYVEFEQCFDKPFWIDVHEVSQSQFKAFGGEAALPSVFTGDNRPRESITWFEAAAFCKKRGVRLPTVVEWEYAARGPDELAFPWGKSFIASNATFADNSERHTWDVGSRPGGVSWIGAYDLSGNVYEWVSTWYAPGPYTTDDGRELPGDSGKYTERLIKGGAWYSSAIDPALSPIFLAKHEPSYEDDSTGFRCARTY